MIVHFNNYSMPMVEMQVLDPEFRKPFQNVNRWFTTLVHQPQFEAVIGKNFTLSEQMAQFDG
jgi:elongation factor 1-gamma